MIYLPEIKNINAWYAVRTRSRCEKKVSIEFTHLDIEHYLPMQKKLRTWSDRKKWVEFPLISGYVFVYSSPNRFEFLRRITNVCGFLRIDGQPAIIPEVQIESLKRLLRQSEIPYEVEYKLFKAGDEVEVIGGPLMGFRGHLIIVKGKNRVAVQLEQFNMAVHIDLPINELRRITPVPKANKCQKMKVLQF